jgi:hypothetical protein
MLVLLATTLSTAVLGLFIPFALIAFQIIPNIGLAGVAYLIGGGTIGLLFGSISTSVSLFKSEKIVTRYYIKLMIGLVMISLLYLISYSIFPEAYSHI